MDDYIYYPIVFMWTLEGLACFAGIVNNIQSKFAARNRHTQGKFWMTPLFSMHNGQVIYIYIYIWLCWATTCYGVDYFMLLKLWCWGLLPSERFLFIALVITIFRIITLNTWMKWPWSSVGTMNKMDTKNEETGRHCQLDNALKLKLYIFRSQKIWWHFAVKML